ncbi:hypothetical protein [Kitasatospora sp. NPDC004289]
MTAPAHPQAERPSPEYRGPAVVLADGREIPVRAELTGNLPQLGLPSWTGELRMAGAEGVGEAVRTGRLRLPGGWEGGFAVIRRIFGVSAVWVRGNDPEVSPADWPGLPG